MIRRAAAAAIVLALALGMTTACQPDPAPSASGPIFANEEEAFAAAEETYRAYVDALNQVDLSDPETFEAVYAWTTGELNASDRKGLTNYHADGVTVSGKSEIVLLEPVLFDSPKDSVELAACLDVSRVEVRDKNGASLVDPDRIDVQTLTVSVVPDAASETGLLVTAIGPRESEPSCSQ